MRMHQQQQKMYSMLMEQGKQHLQEIQSNKAARGRVMEEAGAIKKHRQRLRYAIE